MNPRFLRRTHRPWLYSILLLALVMRALVPAGFMPSADFSFQICPDGFPTQLLQSADPHAAHHHHDSGHDSGGTHEHSSSVRAEHCVFAAAAGVGPAPQIAQILTPFEELTAPETNATLQIPELTRYRVQQPRAPPALS